MEERNYKLYVHISPSNKRYYGITCQKVEDRWKNGKKYKQCKAFHRAIEKYGWENFEHIVLFDNLTIDEANLLEQCYIALYDTTNPKYGYNIALGGGGTLGVKGEKHALYGKHLTEEHKRNLSNSLKGRTAWNKGKPLSQEQKNILIQSHKGRPLAEQTKKKISNSLKGRKVTEQTKKKMSENHADYKGGKHPQAKKVICVTTNEIFNSIAEAGDKYNLYYQNICRVCKGDRKSAGKHPITGEPLVWIYYKDYLQLTNTQIQDIIKNASAPNICNSKKIKCLELNLIFDSIRQANEYLDKNRNSSSICRCLKGHTNTAWGYHWEYVTEEQEEQAI